MNQKRWSGTCVVAFTRSALKNHESDRSRTVHRRTVAGSDETNAAFSQK